MQDMLFLVHRIPFPPNKGDKVRSFHMLRCLSKHYRVHLGTFVDDPADWQWVEQVKQYCGESHFETLDPFSARLKSAVGLLRGEALTLPYYRNPRMQQWVDDLLQRRSIEKVLVFSSAMAQYVAQRQALVRIADFVDIDSDKWRQYAKSKSWPMSWVYRREADRLLEFERDTAQAFDGTTFVTDIEAGHFRDMAPECADKVSFVNNGVDTDYFDPNLPHPDPFPEGEIPVVFTGAMDYWPNVDAVEWFVKEVLPALCRQEPSVRFYIVGARPTEQVQKLAGVSRVVVTGSVPDIRPYLAHASVAVAPLRIARGVQNKVLEAMAMAKTVIASPQAAEGIEATIGVEFLVAETPQQYLEHALAALAGRHIDLSRAARQKVLKRYSWDANLAVFEQLLNGRKALAMASGSPIQSEGAV